MPSTAMRVGPVFYYVIDKSIVYSFYEVDSFYCMAISAAKLYFIY